MTFVWLYVAWFTKWILVNTLPGRHHVDPFPFTFLTLMVSLEAILLSAFILDSPGTCPHLPAPAITPGY
ncbi:hypothetical protein BH11PSE7_BH11PSE7_20310 [soil metagenome]